MSCLLIVSTAHTLLLPHEESRAGFVIDRSDLDIGDRLGGEVYRCRWKSRSLTVAVKRLTGRLEEGEVGPPCGVCVVLPLSVYV